MSTGPIVAGSSVALTSTLERSPSGVTRVRPCRRMASRCPPRATSVTSAPPPARHAPRYPPTAPAPNTAIRIAPECSVRAMRGRPARVLLTVAVTAALATGCQSTAPNTSPAGSGATAACPATDADFQYGCPPIRDEKLTYQPDVVIVDGGAGAIRALSDDGLTWTLRADVPGVENLR